MVPIAVLASGRGSNFEAIQRAIEAGELNAKIEGVISDQPEALVLKRAERFGIPVFTIPFHKEGSLESSRDLHDSRILGQLKKINPRFVITAGYMRILTPRLIEAFRSERGYTRIVNIHPSLLPAFPGVRAYSQAFSYGVKQTGVTVHLVEEEVDSGPICAQESFSIEDCQSETEVEQRGIAIEHRIFPQALRWILPEAFHVEKRSQRRLVCLPELK